MLQLFKKTSYPKLVVGINKKSFASQSTSQTESAVNLKQSRVENAAVPNLVRKWQKTDNLQEVERNLVLRKSGSCLKTVRSLYEKFNGDIGENERKNLENQLESELKRLPNRTHPDIVHYGDEPKTLKIFNERRKFSFKPKEFSEIAKQLKILRTDHLSIFGGHKSYYFMKDLAELQDALIKFAVDELMKRGFKLVTVPDIIPAEIIESCGMSTTGERNQVYKIRPKDLCLSGTSEMALAGYFSNRVLPEAALPKKLMAVSRCFRAETSGLHEEKGIYRVHQFTKVEMFGVCSNTQAAGLLEEFNNAEIDLFNLLGLHFKLLDMPASELGPPAYRKYDIEAWMPGRDMWGEISSCSNCTDYQAHRLNITYETKNGNTAEYVHTVNGTACAVPRLLIALLENYQNENGSVTIPEALRAYMRGKSEIVKGKMLPDMKLVKGIRASSHENS